MDTLTGLPDFGAPLSGETVIFAAFGGGPYAVLPGLGPLTDLQLTMVRRADDLSAAGSYAMLDVEVGCAYALDPTLATVRAATVAAALAARPWRPRRSSSATRG